MLKGYVRRSKFEYVVHHPFVSPRDVIVLSAADETNYWVPIFSLMELAYLSGELR